MVSEGINDASDAPSVLFGDRIDLLRSSLDGAREESIWIGNGKNDSCRYAPERLGAVIEVLGRLIADPKFSSRHRQPCNGAVFISDPINLDGSEGRLVELDSAGSAADI